jgi:hypothetical protein
VAPDAARPRHKTGPGPRGREGGTSRSGASRLRGCGSS